MDINTLQSSLCNVQECSENATLIETDNSATLRKITICNVPQGSILIKMDEAKFNNFFKGLKEWGYNRHCDYALVTDQDIYFFEMKSQNSINQNLLESCKTKFLSDQCVIKYADTIFDILLNKERFFEKRKQHFVLFYQANSLNKTSTFPHKQKQSTGGSPTNFQKIPIANEGIVSLDRII